MWNLARVIAILMVFAIVGCAHQTYPGVYRAPDGSSRLTVCHWDTSPNEQERLYCHDDDRGVW